MRKHLLIIICMASFLAARADHITGGEMFYTYFGSSNGAHSYKVTLKLFMRCNSGRQFPNPAVISIFNKMTNERVMDVRVDISNTAILAMDNSDPCISDPPIVCYEVAYYNTIITLPTSSGGYTLASEVNYRIRGISNLFSNQVGATYTCDVPGFTPIANAFENNSAVFTGSDLVVVCANNYFSYSFAASDADNDQLRYSFCSAFISSTNGINGAPAGIPPYPPAPYNVPDFSADMPLGNNVKIDPQTGLITGVAPGQGTYVVTVCVEETRDGIVIAVQRKDLQINIADCSIVSALLEPEYLACGDTRSVSISNGSNSPLIRSYDWEVLTTGGAMLHASRDATLVYEFPADGVYTVRLSINKGQSCSDETTARVIVFPGLRADFSFDGVCINKPTVFVDRTTLRTGSVNAWMWDFGDAATSVDVSPLQNPTHQYRMEGTRSARLIVSTTDGCRDTIVKQITIIDKPLIGLAFRDTLICKGDRLQLHATGDGTFAWSPVPGITGATSPSPAVQPTQTTRYYVTLQKETCINRDCVMVRVTDRVMLQAMNDTTICSGDTIALRVESDGLRYAWSPSSQLTDPTAKSPSAVTATTTKYEVVAYIGGCSETASLLVNCVPYPLTDAGRDTVICFESSARLHGKTNGDSWSWVQHPSLLDNTTISPVVRPYSTTAYILTSLSDRGCPKPNSDTVLVTVLPPVVADAGNDTTVVIGQSLQLNASGGDTYSWSPAVSLSSGSIANPVAVFHEATNGIRFKLEAFNVAGCSDSAFINVKVYAVMPTVFIPSAFTPNNDGRNDVLRPVLVGMQRLSSFQVYNRWGQLIFGSKSASRGWDGRVNGQVQPSDTYVWAVQAIDYMGNPFFKKGTVTLIR